LQVTTLYSCFLLVCPMSSHLLLFGTVTKVTLPLLSLCQVCGFASMSYLKEWIFKSGLELVKCGYPQEYLSYFQHDAFSNTSSTSKSKNLRSVNSGGQNFDRARSQRGSRVSSDPGINSIPGKKSVAGKKSVIQKTTSSEGPRASQSVGEVGGTGRKMWKGQGSDKLVSSSKGVGGSETATRKSAGRRASGKEVKNAAQKISQ